MTEPVYNSLEPIDEHRHCANVVIETPKGSRVKYAYDPETGLFHLSKLLPEGMVFPFNFGFIPGTVSGDGDALDILLLNDEVLVSGCVVRVQPIGIINATQTNGDREVRNDRLVGQALTKEEPIHPRQLKLTPAMIHQIELFFVSYNQMYGKIFKVSGVGDESKAWEEIHQAIKTRNGPNLPL